MHWLVCMNVLCALSNILSNLRQHRLDHSRCLVSHSHDVSSWEDEAVFASVWQLNGVAELDASTALGPVVTAT